MDYPRFAPVETIEPVPRRIRAVLDGRVVLDTLRALYVWDKPYYPSYWVPSADLANTLLVDQGRRAETRRGTVEVLSVQTPSGLKHGGALRYRGEVDNELQDMVHLRWDVVDAWFEEDEEVFVHPRNPYVRVDALRSARSVTVRLNRKVLAETRSPVMVFETGLPTRYYINRSEVNFDMLVRSETVSACPYKGETSDYWSALVDGVRYDDVAWSYATPLVAVAPIAGLVAFYNEKVEISVDGTIVSPGSPDR